MGLGRRLIDASLVFLLILLIGTVGYKGLGGKEWSYLDAVYMTVITLATVGYGETKDLSNNVAARVFTIFLILLGMGILLFVTSTATAFIVEGELTDILRRRKMNKEIARLRGHFIVCGAGETGLHVMEELSRTLRPFVAIDINPERPPKIEHLGSFLYVIGDATADETLIQAGIEQAKGVVIALPSDKDNLFVTVSARALNQDIKIVAKGIDHNVTQKLFKAGANSVVSPNFIGGLRMASEMIRPTVVSFLDIMLREKEQTLRIEEVELEAGSPLVGKTLKEMGLKERFNLLVLAYKEPAGNLHYNPQADHRFACGYTLVIMGEMRALAEVRGLAAGVA